MSGRDSRSHKYRQEPQDFMGYALIFMAVQWFYFILQEL